MRPLLILAGAAGWQAAKAKGLPIPSERVKPEKSATNVGAKKPNQQRNTSTSFLSTVSVSL